MASLLVDIAVLGVLAYVAIGAKKSTAANNMPPESIDSSSSLVAFMGLTGSGKSSLINLLLGEDKAKIGHDVQSQTSEVAAYRLSYMGKQIVLIDTPGFDDTNKSDLEVMRILYNWLKVNYANGRKLNAVFYLHNITDKRMRGSSLDNLYAFKRLCGDDFFPSVILGTNFWRSVKVHDKQQAVAREAELKTTDDFWKKMISEGARSCRIPDTKPEALKLLAQMANKSPKVMQMQAEAVDQGKAFEATTAHTTLQDRLGARYAEHAREINLVATEAAAARKARDKEAARVAEASRLRQEQERRDLARREQEQKDAAEAHRLRMEALQQEQERAEEQERQLNQAMNKLRLEASRKEKLAGFRRRLDTQIFLLQRANVNPTIIRPHSTAYHLICDNCFENIGVASYYLVADIFKAAQSATMANLICAANAVMLQTFTVTRADIFGSWSFDTKPTHKATVPEW